MERRIRELEAANADLGEAAQLAAHDLKEPLATIALFADTLETEHRDVLDLRGRRLLRGMQEGVERMRLTVADALAEPRRVAREPGTVDMAAAAGEALTTLDSRLRRTSATVSIGPLPSVRGEHTQLVRVMQNLLCNAIKFARGRVTVRALAEDGCWRFEVADDGPGIASERPDPTDPRCGSGLGLAICRGIVERHGGELRAHSGSERGTVVSFTLLAA